MLIWEDIQDILDRWKMQVLEEYIEYNQICVNKNKAHFYMQRKLLMEKQETRETDYLQEWKGTQGFFLLMKKKLV